MLTPYTKGDYSRIVHNATYKLHCKNCQYKDLANDSVRPFYLDDDTLQYAQGIILCDYCGFPCDDDFTQFKRIYNLFELMRIVVNSRFDIVFYYDISKDSFYWSIENKLTCWVDWPIMYDDCTMAYDRPELIPQYIKDKVRKLMLDNKGDSI